MKWEYRTVMIAAEGNWFGTGVNLDGRVFNDKLNELGEDGWELVSVFDTNKLQGRTQDVVAVFKRPGR
ncbi:MAG: DUF4177 domain-containing protein [Isosphaera sp.]|nr:DUF4177 domain-containing protein [Isosphaera sp.]